jgi:hypothetical protein
MFGATMWGNTQGGVVSGTDEFTRWSRLFKQGRLIQIEIVSSLANSNFELLGAKITATSEAEGNLAETGPD